jgi:hypothetical protein
MAERRNGEWSLRPGGSTVTDAQTNVRKALAHSSKKRYLDTPAVGTPVQNLILFLDAGSFGIFHQQ